MKLRAKGFWRFVLFNGVVVWGGIMALAFGVVLPYFDGKPRPLPMVATVCLAGGLAWGVLTWWASERMYTKNQPVRKSQ